MKTSFLVLLLVFTSFVNNYACSCEDEEDFKTKEDLSNYDFIAHVKIVDTKANSSVSLNPSLPSYVADLEILTLFKGKKHQEIIVLGANPKIHGNFFTSCDLLVSKTEEWVVFGYYQKKEDKPITGYCTRSRLYKNYIGERDWLFKTGIKELNKLRKIYQKPENLELPNNGIYRNFYINGQVEIEEPYKERKISGFRKRFYPNGKLISEEYFENGKQEGKSYWYNKQGQLLREYKYKNNFPVDTAFFYNPEYHPNNVTKQIFGKNGIITRIEKYESDTLVTLVSYNIQANITIWTNLYPNGQKKNQSKWDAQNDNNQTFFTNKSWSMKGMLEHENVSYYKEKKTTKMILKNYIKQEEGITIFHSNGKHYKYTVRDLVTRQIKYYREWNIEGEKIKDIDYTKTEKD